MATAPHTAKAQSDAVIGSWEGTLTLPGGSLRLVFHIKANDDGGLRSTMDSPDQGAKGIPTSGTSFADGLLTIEVARIGGKYEGILNGDMIEGNWSQGGQSMTLNLGPHVPTEVKAPDDNYNDVLGDWEGDLDVGGQTLPLVFHIKGDANGLEGTVDSPDQGAMGLVSSETTFNDNVIKLTIPSVGGMFEGMLSNDGNSIDGTWKQGGGSFPLTLTKTDNPSTVNRPQVPEKPYPYREEDVQFDNPEGDNTLAGTLTLPEGAGPFPAAALISGSGPQDRDESLLGHKPFLVIADYLTRQGIAVLRYDDRGVGESTGDFASATSADLATDAAAAVTYLKSRSDIDGANIGLIGHSEGGLIAPMVDAKSDDVAFTVLLAGPGISGRDILVMQQALILEANGMSKEDVAKVSVIQRTMLDKAIELADEPDGRKELEDLYQKLMEDLDDDIKTASGYQEGSEQQMIAQITNPWFSYFLSYDPRTSLRKADAPLLSMIGEKDLQVPAKANTDAIRETLEAAGHKNHKLVILPDLNHLFQTAETGSPNEYATIEETFAPIALETMSAWILEQIQ